MSSGPVTKIRTPQFGVCLNESTQTSARCVLSSLSCGESLVYKAPYETDLACTDPKEVEVGRCKSSLDDERCAPSLASCGAGSKFYLANDPTCSLMNDKSAIGDELLRTTFGACMDTSSDDWQCVLGQEDECLEGEAHSYAKWTADWRDACNCEDVPTGVCYKARTDGGENNLSPENSFCAVSRRDCPSDYFWMSARAFQDSEYAEYKCRLCDGNKVDSKSTFEAGACLKPGVPQTVFSDDDVEVCALEAVACPTGFQFVSSETLAKQGLHCSVEQTKNWGTCSSSGDPVECTNKGDSCLFDFRFETAAECDIHGHFETGLPTYFPYCGVRTDNDERDWRDIRCVWGESECDPAKERWEEARLPVDAWFAGCTCEDIYTGVCKEPSTGKYHCAVSAFACTDPVLYVPQRFLEDEGIDMTCQLCAPRPPPPPTSPPTKSPVNPPTFPPTMPPITSLTNPPIPSPTRSPTRPAEPTKTSSQNLNRQSNLSTGAIAGIAIGGLVACSLITLIIVWATRNKGQKAPQKEFYPNAPSAGSDEKDPEIVIS